MSSYFDFFCKNVDEGTPQDTTNEGRIVGTCSCMCPEDEVRMRVRENLVHMLEVWNGQKMLVKSYSRSAADCNMAVPRHLRPYDVLRRTVQYLLLDVGARTDVSTPTMYDFLNDRLRAVRQDMTIQRLPPEESVTLLEPMIRFYVHFGYKLSNHPVKDFDAVLHNKYLLECLKWYLKCCDKLTEAKSDEFTELLFKMDLNKDNLRLVNDRVLMESLYILCNLDNVHPLLRYMNLGKDLKSDPKLQLAYEIAIANLQGNYIKVCRLMDGLCPLAYCALFTYLPTLQRRALLVLCHAYNSKQLSVPSTALARWLRLPHAGHARAVCAHYGLRADGDEVHFDKTAFKPDVAQHQLKPEDLTKKFNVVEIDIYTY